MPQVTPIDALTSLLGPLLDPGQRVFAPFLGFAVLAAVLLRPAGAGLKQVLGVRLWRHRSSLLDGQLALTKGLLRSVGLLPALVSAYALALAVARGLDGAVGAPGWSLNPTALTAFYSVVLFVVWDASRYALHRLLHEVPALWSLHQVHHSAEVLTPLTFYRTHPLESLLYGARDALATGLTAGVFLWAFRGAAVPLELLGVSAAGFVLNAVFGNLRHSHVWLTFGRAEGWFISPAQHQLHHTRDGSRCNYGTWLAIWDRLSGTLERASRRPFRFGLPASELNHDPGHLASALLGPLGRLRGVALAGLALFGLVGPAFAQEAQEGEEPAAQEAGEDQDADEGQDAEEAEEGDDDDPDDVSEVVSVVAKRRGIPRVAGSAHVVEQEQLERREYDDIHRVVAHVPGVYVREEDGYGLRPNIGLRGASSDRSSKVTLMEDGVLLGPAPYSAPAAYFFPTTTRMVGVEIFKGPAATRHGPNTIGGAVNLLTRPVPESPELSLDAGFGLNRTWKLHGVAGARNRNAGFVIEGVHLASDGFKRLDGGGPTGFDKTEIMLKGLFETNPTPAGTHTWEIKLGYANERSMETYLGLTDADFADSPVRRYSSSSEGLMRWNRTQAELRWTGRISSHVTVTAVGYHHWMDRSWRKLNRLDDGTEDGPPAIGSILSNPDAGLGAVYSRVLRGELDSSEAGVNLAVGTNQRAFHSAGVQTLLRWKERKGIIGHELEAGVRVHGDRIRRDHTEDFFAMTSGELIPTGDPTTQDVDNLGEALAVAVHVHEDLAIGPVRVLPGFRAEIIRRRFEDRALGTSTVATDVVPLFGLGLHAQPIPELALLGGIHRGFSPVSPGQPKETLPESSWNVEGGARFGWRGTRAEAIGFFNDYDNLTGSCTFSAGCGGTALDTQLNAGQVHVYGLEAAFGQAIVLPASLQLEAHVSYTWTGSQFRTQFNSGSPLFGDVRIGDSLPYVPEHQGNAAIALVGPVGSFEISATGQTAMRDLPGQGEIPDALRIPGHVVVDLFGDLRLIDGVKIYGSVNNLLNSSYLVSRRPFGARPGRPFHFMVGVKLEGLPTGQPGLIPRPPLPEPLRTPDLAP